jgi:hypothetical protein
MPSKADFNEEEEVQCQRCKRGVNLYYEPIFIMNIDQERWCRQCAVRGMKWSMKHPLLKGELNGR